MNTQELLNTLKIVGSTLFGILAMHGYMTTDQASAIMSDLTIAVPALLSLGTMAWSIYSHWNMKKVPENAVAIEPHAVVGTPVVGATVGLPSAAKVVGTILIAAFALSLFLANGSAQAQIRKPAVTGNPIQDLKTDLAPANTAPNAVVTPGQGGLLTPDALIKKIIALSGPDLVYAAAMASNANTNAATVRLGCIKAIQTLNTQASGANLKNADGTPMTMPTEPHIFTDLETIAEGIDSLSPTGPLYTSCAGAAALAQTNVLTFINQVVTGVAATTLAIPK